MLTGEIFNVISPHYVADCPRDHFLVSPGLGNLENLGKISVFSGTHDILYTYALDFKKRLQNEGYAFNFYEYPKMMHVWTAITLMKEARTALKQMATLINQ
jgi:acetyl esterase/lipase